MGLAEDGGVLSQLSLALCAPEAHSWHTRPEKGFGLYPGVPSSSLRNEIIILALLIIKGCRDDQMRYGNWLR